MKTLCNYITEKQSFLVKKHVKHTKKIESFDDVENGDIFTLSYTANSTSKPQIIKMLQKGKNESRYAWVINRKYDEVFLSQIGHIQTGIYSTPDDEEYELAMIVEEYIKNHPEVQGYIDNNKVNSYKIKNGQIVEE